MRLKRLEVYGFKSFANRMVFDFSEGLTVIVGPNGSGKSNLVDSILWIVGEMSPKALRGTGMADVIFSGSRNRRAYGYAEGTLVFSNEDRSLNVDADEVSITRTINRSGESEYFINGERCRLTDVRVLLQGSGLGIAEYSIIQQGAVEKLVGKDSKSRRSVFDEAAGISIYKYRRERALRKLEKVDLNLERLGDRIEATERELRSLKRRARAAERYQEVSRLWREKELLLCNLRYRELHAAVEEKRRTLEEVRKGMEEAASLEGTLSAEAAALEETYLRAARAVEEAERKRLELEHAATQHENAVRWLGERMEEKKQAVREMEEREREILEKKEEGSREMEKLRLTIREIDEEVGKKREACAEAEERLEAVRKDFGRLMQILEGKKKSLEETYANGSSTKNEIDTLRAERGALLTNRKEMEEKLEDKERDGEALDEEVRRVESAIERHEEDRARVSRELDALIGMKERLAEEKDALAAETSRLTHELTRVDSRLHLLMDLESGYEGIRAGVKGILEALKADGELLPGVYGMVADFIEVDIKDEEVIETALGDNVQNIIVDTVEHALNAVAYLVEHDLGHATFMPEEAIRNGFDVPPDLLDREGIECRAVDLVSYRKEHEGIVKQLLGGTVIAESIEAVGNIDSALLADVTVVTRDGYVIENNGMITGGSGKKSGGIISRKNEIAKLKGEREEYGRRIKALREKAEAVDGRIAEVLRKIEEAEAYLDGINESITEQRKQLVKLERDQAHLKEFTHNLAANIVSTGVRIEEIDDLLTEKEGRFQWFEKLAELLNREIDMLERKVHALAGERDALQEKISEAKVSLATTAGRKERIAERISNLKEMLTALDVERERNRQAAEKARRETERAAVEIEEKKKAAAALRAELRKTEEDLAVRRERREKARNEYELVKSKYKDVLGESRRAAERVRELELELQDLVHKKEEIENRVMEHHDIDIRELNETFTPPEEEVDTAELEREVKRLYAERNSIRGADPTAVEQLESVKLRAEFLALQRDDLQKARDTLRGLIARINRETGKRFMETFEAIREHFKVFFRKMFGGGRADLVLEPEQDVLEAGVEIVCRPPGSKLRSISLLSGGQKAMVIISLLFAVLKAKPSPVCVLDEIDGPLDEANVDRFLALVREFMDRSQFIVISHNKRTASKADVLYGITMQEPGVSTKLSLRFEDIRNDERFLGGPRQESALVR